MTRLDLLHQELETVKKLRLLSFVCKEKCIEYYEHEIECIEVYGSSNTEVKEV